MLLAAWLPWLYGYFQLLRLVSCVVFGWLSFVTIRGQSGALGAIFIALTLLFNPVFPVHLPRLWWNVIDSGAAILLIVHMRPAIFARTERAAM